jgi:hypothetical protein
MKENKYILINKKIETKVISVSYYFNTHTHTHTDDKLIKVSTHPCPLSGMMLGKFLSMTFALILSPPGDFIFNLL